MKKVLYGAFLFSLILAAAAPVLAADNVTFLSVTQTASTIRQSTSAPTIIPGSTIACNHIRLRETTGTVDYYVYTTPTGQPYIVKAGEVYEDYIWPRYGLYVSLTQVAVDGNTPAAIIHFKSKIKTAR